MKGVLLGLVFLIGLSTAGVAQTPAKIDDPEAYAIYSVILTPEPSAKIHKQRRWVINEETADYPSYGEDDDSCLKPLPENEALLRPLIDAYRKANKTPSILEKKIVIPVQYEIVPKATIYGFFDKNGPGGWTNFNKRFPNSGGYIELSAVGFNSDKTMALVYSGHSCGGLCGGGGYFFLKKVNGKWTEANWPGQTCTWVS